METMVKMLMTKENEKEFRTSDGFFRDPYTGENFTGNEERVDLDKGLRTPRIKDSQGNSIPISYKFWTKEEREHYNEGKGTGTKRTGTSSKKNSELRTQLLELEKFLSEKMKGDDLVKVKDLIGKMLPDDPEEIKKQNRIKKLEEELKKLKEEL